MGTAPINRTELATVPTTFHGLRVRGYTRVVDTRTGRVSALKTSLSVAVNVCGENWWYAAAVRRQLPNTAAHVKRRTRTDTQLRVTPVVAPNPTFREKYSGWSRHKAPADGAGRDAAAVRPSKDID